MTILKMRNVSLTYPGTVKAAVEHLNLSIRSGEIHALVGESGCGKSSTIRMIAGLEIPSGGEIYYGDHCLNRQGAAVPPEERNIGMVFQDNALFPHLTVAENILFGVREKERRNSETVREYLSLTGLQGLEQRYPHEISGGQMQRVALARALAPLPDMILMDEPFNNLDIRIKRSLLEDINGILRKTGTTCLFITHEKSEAFIMADRISVMRNGALLQTATPEKLYREPADSYVAEFFGRANHIRVKNRDGALISSLGTFPLAPAIAGEADREEGILIHRPWDIEFSEEGDFEIQVDESFFFGDYQEVRFRPMNVPGESFSHECYKFFTHISKRFTKGDILRINIPADRLYFCSD